MKVKRILSSILATVMVATSLVAVNVSSVMAADTVTTTKWDFSSNSTTGAIAIDGTIDATSSTGTTKSAIVKGTAEKTQYGSGNLNLKSGAILWLPIDSSTKSIVLKDFVTQASAKDNRRYVVLGKTEKETYILESYTAKVENEVEISDLTDLLETDADGNKYLPVTSKGDYKTQYFILEEKTTTGLPDNYVKVTGTISAEYVTANQTTLYFVDSTDSTLKYKAKITDLSYSVDLPKGKYKIALESPAYKEAQSFMKTSACTVDSAKEFNIEVGSAITDIWDFTNTDGFYMVTDKYYQIYNGTGTVKGLGISGAKFDVRLNNEDAQVNAGTTITVPVVGDNKEVKFYRNVNNAEVDVTGEFNITKGTNSYVCEYPSSKSSNIYISKIVLTEKETSPFTIKTISNTGTPGECIVIGQFSGENLADYSKVVICLGKAAGTFGQEVESETIYNGIVLDTQHSFTTDEFKSVFAALVKELPSSPAADDRVYARAYAVKADGTTTAYSNSESKLVSEINSDNATVTQ